MRPSCFITTARQSFASSISGHFVVWKNVPAFANRLNSSKLRRTRPGVHRIGETRMVELADRKALLSTLCSEQIQD